MEAMAVQAALDGQGVALVGDVLVEDHLATGRLIRPFDVNLSQPLAFSYYLLSALDSVGQPKIEAFRSWLLREVSASQSEDSENRTN